MGFRGCTMDFLSDRYDGAQTYFEYRNRTDHKLYLTFCDDQHSKYFVERSENASK